MGNIVERCLDHLTQMYGIKNKSCGQFLSIRCECGSCEVMKTRAECVCCVEITATDHIRESCDLECITQHQSFIDNCLNVRVLEVSMYDFIQREGPLDDNEHINE